MFIDLYIHWASPLVKVIWFVFFFFCLTSLRYQVCLIALKVSSGRNTCATKWRTKKRQRWSGRIESEKRAEIWDQHRLWDHFRPDTQVKDHQRSTLLNAFWTEDYETEWTSICLNGTAIRTRTTPGNPKKTSWVRKCWTTLTSASSSSDRTWNRHSPSARWVALRVARYLLFLATRTVEAVQVPSRTCLPTTDSNWTILTHWRLKLDRTACCTRVDTQWPIRPIRRMDWNKPNWTFAIWNRRHCMSISFSTLASEVGSVN